MTAVAVLFALPAAAAALSPWPLPNADAGATNQSSVAGPTDPGLEWHLDLGDVEADFAPEGYRNIRASDHRILLSDAGVMIAMVRNNDRQSETTARFVREMIGIDLDDDEVLWEIGSLSPGA